MISKELLSKVLKSELYNNKVLQFNFTSNKNIIWIRTEMANDFEINIYELAHKCKKYAINKSFIVETSYEDIIEPFGEYCICRVYFDGDKFYDNYSEHQDYQTEPEAIFKATSYIMEQLKQNA